MAERRMLIMSGLVGLAVLHWLSGYEDRWRGVVHRRGVLDWLREAWARLNPAGDAIAVGWLLMGGLTSITVGLVGLES